MSFLRQRRIGNLSQRPEDCGSRMLRTMTEINKEYRFTFGIISTTDCMVRRYDDDSGIKATDFIQ